MRTYLQTALNTAYGAGKITVGNTTADGSANGTNTGDIFFTTTDTSSVLSINSSDNTNVLNEGCCLKIGAGESNRLELSKTLEQLTTLASGKTEISGLAPGADGYKINVNGKEFTFAKDTTLSSVISQINNDATANVTIAYSSITNTFNVKADGSGASSKVDISDVSGGGNLASSLFGTEKAIQSSSAITEDSTLPTTLSGAAITMTLGGIQKTITFTTGEEAQYGTAAGICTYLQTKLDAEFGSGKVSVTNNGGVLKLATTDISSDLSIDSSTKPAALDALKIAASSSTASGSYVVNAGQDAKLKVSFDGGTTFTDITRTENTFTLDCVNFNLLGTTDPNKSLADTTIKFTSNSNVDTLYKKISDFVNDYNDVVNLINGKVSETKEKDPSYAPLSDEQKAQMTDTQITDWNKHAVKGVLQNDSTLSQISGEMRTVMTSLVDSTNLKALSKIGIATSSYDYDTATNGKLIINETELKKALTEHPGDVAALFTATDPSDDKKNGISTKLKKVLDVNVGTFGGDGTLIALAGKATNLADQSIISKDITDYNKNIKELKSKLSDEQERLWAKFTAMETQLSHLQSQSSWLSQQTSNS
jgi:flagellar capping protein FliD